MSRPVSPIVVNRYMDDMEQKFIVTVPEDC